MMAARKKSGSQALRCDRYPSLIVQGTIGEAEDATAFSVSFVNGLAEVDDAAVAGVILGLTETDTDEVLVSTTDEQVPAVGDDPPVDPSADDDIVGSDDDPPADGGDA